MSPLRAIRIRLDNHGSGSSRTSRSAALNLFDRNDELAWVVMGWRHYNGGEEVFGAGEEGAKGSTD